MKIVHLIPNEKFSAAYYEFIRIHFAPEDHVFFFVGGRDEKLFPIPQARNVVPLRKRRGGRATLLLACCRMLIELSRSRRVILHSLFLSLPFLVFFSFAPLVRKSAWVIWGDDLYCRLHPRKTWMARFRERIRKKVVRQMGGLVTYVRGDYELAKDWYQARGQYFENIMYPSNLCPELTVCEQTRATNRVLVGNSADPSNRHIEIFEQLSQLGAGKFEVVVPLSYGDTTYAKRVVEAGKEFFGDRFFPLESFLSPTKYLSILQTVDIAIFAHKRQQAMGNIISLLGLGKKVYLRSDISTWSFLQTLGVRVFDSSHIDLEPISPDECHANMLRVRDYFSIQTLVAQQKRLFSRG